MNEVLARAAEDRVRDEVLAVLKELRHILRRLRLVDHQVRAVQLDSTGGPSASEDIGGRRPAGWDEDRVNGGLSTEEKMLRATFLQQSADHYLYRLKRCRTLGDLRAVLSDAKAALHAWQRQGRAWGMEPIRDSFEWKCQIADDPREIKKAAAFYGISARTVSRYRTDYRGVMEGLTKGIDHAA